MNEIRIRAVMKRTGCGMNFTLLSAGNSSQKLKFYIVCNKGNKNCLEHEDEPP